MGTIRVRARRSVLSLLTSVTVALAAQVGFALQHPALAASCDDTWNGSTADWNTAADWSGGVPTLSSNACLPAGSYTVTLNGDQAIALTLVIAAGPTLVISHDNSNNAGSLTVSSNATNAGTIQVGDSQGTPEEHLSIGGTLTNTGTLLTVAPSAATSEAISGNVINQGTFTISQSTALFNTAGATLTNMGAISIASGGALRLDQTIFSFNGGTLTNDGFFIQNGGVFNHNGGTATGPPLVLNGVTISPDPVSGSATFVMFGPNTLASDVSPGETLVITHDPGNNAGSLTVSSNATNAGTIQVGESGSNVGDFLSIGGTLTNTGALMTVGLFTGTPERISGNVINQGLFTVRMSTAQLNTPGATLTNTGAIAIAAAAALTLSGTSFNFNGGTLTTTAFSSRAAESSTTTVAPRRATLSFSTA